MRASSSATAASLRDRRHYASDHARFSGRAGAVSLSPVFRPVAPRPPSWVRLIRTFMQPSACIPDWPAGRPGICPPPSPPCGRVGCQSLQVRVGPTEVFRPSCFMVIATRPSALSTAIRLLPRRRLRQICGPVSAMARLLAESATPAPFRPTRAGVHARAMDTSRSRSRMVRRQRDRLITEPRGPDASREMMRFFRATDILRVRRSVQRFGATRDRAAPAMTWR